MPGTDLPSSPTPPPPGGTPPGPAAAAALAALRDDLPRLLRAAPVSVALLDPAMRYVAWSRRWAEDFGLGGRDLAGLPHDEAVPDLAGSWREPFRRALAGEASARRDDRVERADGRILWLHWEIRPVRSAAGEVAGLVVLTEDVTARKAWERSLSDSEERLSVAAAAAGFGIFEVDLASSLATWSDGALAAAGLDASQVPRTFDGWAAVVPPEDMVRLRAAQARAFDPHGDGRISVEVRMRGALGPRWVQILGRVHFEGEGAARHPVRIVGVAADQTEAQRTRAALTQAQRVETVGRLAGVVAHDFNNLLSVIQANLDLAEMRSADGELRLLLQRAREATEMGASFNRRLLSLVGGGELRPHAIHPVARLAETHALLARVLGETITVRLDAAPGTWPVLIDPGELDGAILNLAVNARDAMPRGGAIVIATANVALSPEAAARLPRSRPGEFVRIAVTDQGVGMTPEVAAQALDPFFTTKAPGRGTGLGLTSVASVAARAGGFVEIASSPGAGATVAIWLPRHLGPAPGAADPPADELPLGDGELVLVVEDDALVREATMRRLEVLGYAVIEAGDAAQAVALLDAGEPVDLVLSDVVMPGEMSGYGLADLLRRRDPAVPVLLTSGYASLHVAGVRSAPPVELLPKPYSIQTLAREVRRALRGRAGPRP